MLIWESSDPYLYLRTTADDRIICGGEDEESAEIVRADLTGKADTDAALFAFEP